MKNVVKILTFCLMLIALIYISIQSMQSLLKNSLPQPPSVSLEGIPRGSIENAPIGPVFWFGNSAYILIGEMNGEEIRIDQLKGYWLLEGLYYEYFYSFNGLGDAFLVKLRETRNTVSTAETAQVYKSVDEKTIPDSLLKLLK